MFVPFESISPSSRIWIYQSDRKLSDQDKTIISEHLKLFTEEWVAHGQPLKASFEVKYDHFIVLTADEDYNSASGCSIDTSVRAIKELSQRLNINFFNRNQVAFKNDSTIDIVSLPDLKQKYLAGVWNERTFTFNNVIQAKRQLEEEWIIPAGNTWLKRYVPNETLAN